MKHEPRLSSDYVPKNKELNEAVEEEGTHTMSGSDLRVPLTSGRAFCGVIYFTVALFDLRNGNGVVHHGGQFCFHQQNIISRSRQNRNIHNRVTRKQLNSYI